jgi:hypothetical protein
VRSSKDPDASLVKDCPLDAAEMTFDSILTKLKLVDCGAIPALPRPSSASGEMAMKTAILFRSMSEHG